MTSDASRTAPAVEVENLHKVYQLGPMAVPALRGVDLVVQRGDYVAIMGPSGCGKTTFLNMVGLLDLPTRGTVHIGGIDAHTLGERRLADLRGRSIGFVFQFYNLLGTLTAAENVEIPMTLAGVRRKERRGRARELLQRVDLADRADHLPSELSGGEQQRVTIARALANRPDLVLLDEPTGDLDSTTETQIMDVLNRLNQDEGVTYVLVTHDRKVAVHAQRIVHFLDGKITGVEDVTPQERSRSAGAADDTGNADTATPPPPPEADGDRPRDSAPEEA